MLTLLIHFLQAVKYTADSADHGKSWTCEAYTDDPSVVQKTVTEMNVLCKFTYLRVYSQHVFINLHTC